MINIIEEKKLIPLKFDLMFKKVFGNEENKEPLKNLLKCILDISPKEITILNPEIIGSSYYDKRTIVDLIVELEDGTKISVEMNTNVNKYLIDRNLFYMFKIMSKNIKKGKFYNEFNKHIQINIDCEGNHVKPIETYKILEQEKYKLLTDKIEIIRVDLPYYVKKCYNEDVKKLDYKDKFIGLIGIEDRILAKSITKGEKDMEDILNKVEDFSDDEEILGAYDAEWHKMETERVVRLANMEEHQRNQEEHKRNQEEHRKNQEKLKKLQSEIEKEKEQIKKSKEELEKEKIKLIKNMLEENFDVELISKITGLNIKQINELKK